MERETWKRKHALGFQSVCSSDGQRVCSRMRRFGTDGLRWCHQNQTWEKEYRTRRTSRKRRSGRGVGIKWEQPTGNASCRVSYINFVCRCVVPVTVHPHLLLLQSRGCIASIYNRCQALGISSAWAQEFDLFYGEMWSINVLFWIKHF